MRLVSQGEQLACGEKDLNPDPEAVLHMVLLQFGYETRSDLLASGRFCSSRLLNQLLDVPVSLGESFARPER